MKSTKERVAGLGSRLAEYRQRHRYSLRALGAKLGLSAPSVGEWEAGTKSEPGLSMLLRLADIYGCSTDELLGRPVVGGNVSVTNGNAAVAGHDINGNIGTSACAECARKDAVIAEQQKQIGQLIALLGKERDSK